MKQPKLKYYYYAMTSDAYIDFAVSRRLEVNPTLSIDLLTGAVTGRTHLHLCSTAMLADVDFRLQHGGYKAPVYVLRIPRDCIDRSSLTLVTDNIWRSEKSIEIPHCGVERIEFDPNSAVEETRTIDSPVMYTLQL